MNSRLPNSIIPNLGEMETSFKIFKDVNRKEPLVTVGGVKMKRSIMESVQRSLTPTWPSSSPPGLHPENVKPTTQIPGSHVLCCPTPYQGNDAKLSIYTWMGRESLVSACMYTFYVCVCVYRYIYTHIEMYYTCIVHIIYCLLTPRYTAWHMHVHIICNIYPLIINRNF